MATTSETNYTKGAVSLKKIPKKGENVNLFLRPGDELNLGVNLENAELQLVGSDVIATLPSGGQITFVSLGMMAFEDGAPTIKLPSGLKMDIGDVLNRVQDIATAPKDAILVSGPVSTPDEKDESKKEKPQKSEEAPTNNYNAFYVEVRPEVKLQEEFAAKSSFDKYEAPASLQSISVDTPRADITRKTTYTSDAVYRQAVVEVPKNDFDAKKSDYVDYIPKNDFDAKKSDYVDYIPKNDFDAKKSDYVDYIPKNDFDAKKSDYVDYAPKNEFDAKKNDFIDYAPKNDFTDYFPENKFTGFGNGNGNGTGAVSEAAKPVFYFKASAYQMQGTEYVDSNGVTQVLGGGGSAEGYTDAGPSAQFQVETIDKRADSNDLVITVDNPAFFANDNSANYLTRVLRFVPQMPEGFYVDNFAIGTLPAGITLIDKNGNTICLQRPVAL
jgi:hypothetical protein